MEIKRDFHLDKLINRKHNGLIKVITGIRRCGKSYLLIPSFMTVLRSGEHDFSVPGDNGILFEERTEAKNNSNL